MPGPVAASPSDCQVTYSDSVSACQEKSDLYHGVRQHSLLLIPGRTHSLWSEGNHIGTPGMCISFYVGDMTQEDINSIVGWTSHVFTGIHSCSAVMK